MKTIDGTMAKHNNDEDDGGCVVGHRSSIGINSSRSSWSVLPSSQSNSVLETDSAATPSCRADTRDVPSPSSSMESSVLASGDDSEAVESSEEDWRDDYAFRKAPRHGKRALKHLLVKRRKVQL